MQTGYRIVKPEKASKSETYAAWELQKYMQRVLQKPFPIVKDDENVALGDRYISVGKTKLAQGLNTSNLNVDGFRIKTEGETVLIKGQRDAGTLFGVYDFLEKFLGVKFLTADYEYVPRKDDLKLNELDITEIPTFETRFYHSYKAKVSQEGTVKMRLMPSNFYGEESLKHKFGGSGFEHIGRYHAYNEYIPYRLYRDKHPEWFSEPNEKGKVQPSLANGLTDDGEIDETMEESVLKTVIESVKKFVLNNPKGIYVCLGHNDCHNWCEYEADVHQREIFGGYAGHCVVFVNAVAKAVDEWLQEKKIDRKLKYWLFAYGLTVEPPDQTAEKAYLAVPRDNVYIMPALLQDAWNIPLNDPRNPRPCRVLPAWQKLTKNFFMYDYVGNFANRLNWRTLRVLKPNALYYRELGVQHYTSEGGCYGYSDKLRIYILSKLMWNVDRDVQELISEFNRYCFGEKAGPILDEMVNFIEKHYYHLAFEEGEYKRAGLYDVGSPWEKSAETLNVEFVSKVENYAQKAKVALEKDEALTEKQREEMLLNLNDVEVMVDMMKYLNYDELWKTTDEAKNAFMRKFYERVQKTGIMERALVRFGSKWPTTIDEEFAKHGIY